MLQNPKILSQTARRRRNPPKRTQRPRGTVLRVASCLQHVFTHLWHQTSRPRAICPTKNCEDTCQKRLKAERGANTFSKRLAVLSPRPASRTRTTRRRGRQEGRQAKSDKAWKGLGIHMPIKNRTPKPHLWEITDTNLDRLAQGARRTVKHPARPKNLPAQFKARVQFWRRLVMQLSSKVWTGFHHFCGS